MPVLVLALGAVMAAAGAGLMVYGNGYIAMEQGWSAFIAGSVLLTGGLVTVALGLALRALADLRGALAGELLRATPRGYAGRAELRGRRTRPQLVIRLSRVRMRGTRRSLRPPRSRRRPPLP